MKSIIPPDKMKDYWEERASQDALFWTWSNKVSEEEYFKSGVNWVEEHVKKYFPINKGKCIEIGCGVGRVTIALASYFEQVVGIDISERMIRKAFAYKEKFKVNNVEYINNTSLLSHAMNVDFIFTLTVFQHMYQEIWWKYIVDGYEILNAGGRFYVHALFDLVDDSIKKAEEIGYKLIAKEQEGDCWILILEK